MKTLDTRLAKQTVEYGVDDLVVLISHETLISECDKERNVFRTTKDGTVVWQIGAYDAFPNLSTFTNVEVRGNEIFAYNFDGGWYRIDPVNGRVLHSELMK